LVHNIIILDLPTHSDTRIPSMVVPVHW